jgi:Fe2+ transport system protein B
LNTIIEFEFFLIAVRRLENSQATKGNRKSVKNQSSTSKQRLRKKKGDGTIPDEEKDVSTSNTVNSFENQTSIKEKTITGKGFFFDLGLFIGIVLLFLHIYLCYKLYSVDQALQSHDSTCFNQCQQGLLVH